MNSPKEKSVELEANAAALETEVEKPFPFPEVMTHHFASDAHSQCLSGGRSRMTDSADFFRVSARTDSEAAKK